MKGITSERAGIFPSKIIDSEQINPVLFTVLPDPSAEPYSLHYHA